MRDYLRPQDNFGAVFFRLTVPLLLFFGVDWVATRNLSRLFPKSSIGLGLARKRRQDSDNLRSLIIFGVILGLLVAVAGNFAYQALT